MPSVGSVHYVTASVRSSCAVTTSGVGEIRSAEASVTTGRYATAVFGTYGTVSLSLDTSPASLHLVYQFDDFGELQFDDFSTVNI